MEISSQDPKISYPETLKLELHAKPSKKPTHYVSGCRQLCSDALMLTVLVREELPVCKGTCTFCCALKMVETLRLFGVERKRSEFQKEMCLNVAENLSAHMNIT